ncbi:MAG: DUF3298 domain-containing protein [Clostridia bacterium]|nr:DUF3298 domain-containing protein [Clostridia bacterium]
MRLVTAYMLAVAFALLAFALSGCAKKTKPGSDTSRPVYYVEPEDLAAPQSIVRHSLPIMAKSASINGCTVQYPYICSAGMDALNITMHSVFMEFADEFEVNGGKLGYSVEFNRYGLLSFLVTYRSESGQLICSDAANFDCDTGRRVFVSDCFGEGAGSYSASLRAIVERNVAVNGYTVISGIPDITDESPFLFTFGGLILLYREYEICSADAGELQIRIRYDSVSEHVTGSGLLNRVN